MKKNFIKNLPLNAFIFAYSAFSFVFYCFLVALYGNLQQMSFTQNGLPVGAIIGIGLYVAIKLILSVALIKSKGPKAERNISAIVTTDMFFTVFFFVLILYLFVSVFNPRVINNGFIKELGFFAIAFAIIILYNTPILSCAIWRPQPFRRKPRFRLFIAPINMVLLFLSVFYEIAFWAIKPYHDISPERIVTSITFCLVNLAFMSFCAIKGLLTKRIANWILTLNIVSRYIYYCLLSLIFQGTNYNSTIYITLYMSIPWLSGAIIARIILSRKEKNKLKDKH